MFARLAQRPLLVALLIGLAAQTLFAVNLGRPDRIVFDETHYVPSARAMIALDRPTNTEHPMLGKELIAAGMLIAGDTPVGWRLMASIAASITVVAVFAFLFLLTGGVKPAASGALLVAINQMVFVQARTGMLDAFLGMFVLTGMTALLWAMRGSPAQVRWRWALGSALLGAAVAVKWAAAPYLVFAGLAFVIVRRRKGDAWPGLGMVSAAAIMAAVSVSVYFLTFLPAFFFRNDPVTLGGLIPLQWAMYQAQTQVLAAHPYQSQWWSWPLMIRPIWYFYEPAMGAQRGIILLGNPLVMWGGLIAVAACYWAWAREKAWRPLAMALIWTASLAMWAIIPKSLGFYYYYYLSGIFIAMSIAVAFDHYRDRIGYADEIYMILSIALFAHFYPIIAAGALPDANGFARYTWFTSWR